jgi:hypothetical protein
MVVGWVAKIDGRLLLVTIDTNLCNARKKCNDSMLLMFCPDTWWRTPSLLAKFLLPVNLHWVKLMDFGDSSFGSSYRSTKNSDTAHAWLSRKESSTLLSASIVVASLLFAIRRGEKGEAEDVSARRDVKQCKWAWNHHLYERLCIGRASIMKSCYLRLPVKNPWLKWLVFHSRSFSV